MNPLHAYRRAQRQVRALFEPFTRVHCPGCATPCCRKPTWVRPTDLILVQELGYALPVASASPVDAARGIMDHSLAGAEDGAGAPCDFLTPTGCPFPADLRPFGCAAFICDPMRASLPPAELAEVEAAVRTLERAHTALMAALYAPLSED
jgi:hypothetical protein